MNDDTQVAQVYPPEVARALVEASFWGPQWLRMKRIDEITDRLVRAGLVRPRDEDKSEPTA